MTRRDPSSSPSPTHPTTRRRSKAARRRAWLRRLERAGRLPANPPGHTCRHCGHRGPLTAGVDRLGRPATLTSCCRAAVDAVAPAPLAVLAAAWRAEQARRKAGRRRMAPEPG